ncbi:hypothetical protein OWR29_27270 [Actinoplanes sp. Pm04-4]|uniref:Uncharacterized protein n=1 Tax=Paractinoplanes pyxinae TaxID=2997416 RepID=A0ABT4B776_9ACTN|nr:hypothetical protein [Actinoplanes pyxinae]MCY1141715.1 hypothetical protein [Actinoplanes pyxinae]
MTSPGGGSLGALFVSVRPETTRFEPELSSATVKAGERAADAAGPGMGRRLASHISTALAAGTGILAVGLAKGLGAAVKSASDLNETISKTNTVFGKNSNEIQRWASQASTSMGQSKKAALDGAATFAIYGKQAGLTSKDLVGFSTGLSGLASDMASFSNTSPEEAIEAIGAAMRGESDPIEKYGVLLNEASLKSTALKNGIINTTNQALTPQQRVLAVQAALYEQLGTKGSKTIGDFERTSAGLANQQRIAKAELANFGAEIGTSFLPVVTRLVKKFNEEMLPAFQTLWRREGPAVVSFVSGAADKFGGFATKVADADISGWIDKFRDAAGAAAPYVKTFIANFREGGKDTFADTLKVSGAGMKFLADNVDTLVKALPAIAAVVAIKELATTVSTLAEPFRVAGMFAQAAATRQLAASTAALAASSGTAAATTPAAAAGTTAFGGAIRFAMGPLGLIITVLGAATAAVVYLYKHNETARKIIDGAWKFIKKAIKVVGDWITDTLWPSIKRAISQLVESWKWLRDTTSGAWNAMKDKVVGAWHGLRDGVMGGWKFIRDKVFNPVKNFVSKTIPDAFKSGVNTVKAWWDKLKDFAATPARFVINTVFNGIGGVFNKVADFLHLPGNLRAPEFKANFAHGGQFSGRLPGAPSDVDNMVGYGPGGQPIGLAGGEYVVNARQTKKHLPVLQAINDGQFKGYAFGGLIDFLSNPVKYVKGKVSGVIGRIRDVAGGPYGEALIAMADRVRDGAIDRLKSLMGGLFGDGGGRRGGSGTFGGWPSSPSAQRGDSGVWRGIVSLIRSTGPISGSFGNAYRPGDPKWHGSGRAVDWMGYNQDALASYLAARRPLELIHRTRHRDYAYTRGVNKGSFNNALMQQHRNHIHVAFGAGGKVPTFDTGGVLAPGYNMVHNATGRPEPLRRADQPMRWHPADLRMLAQMMAQEMRTVVGATAYSAGRQTQLYARGA